MVGHLARRALIGAAIVFGVVTLTFFLLRLAPGDPVSLLLGPAATPDQITVQRHLLGFDRPLMLQYLAWVGRFVRGDWGISIATSRPVGAMLAEAWPATVALVGSSLILSYLLGLAVGIIQAATGRRALDTTLSVVTVTLFAMPGYWLGVMLVMVFTYWLGILPAFGASGLDADFLSRGGRVVDHLRHLALPLLTLTLIGIGGAARFVRGSMLDVKRAQFITVARAKGLGNRRVTLRHMLGNAMVPVVTLLGLSLPALFSGAVFVEAIFAWPGVGQVLVKAVQGRDYPVILAATAVSAGLVVLGNLAADLLVSWVDPRVRATEAR
ncbi:MAG: ABC transporter permease [Gemmatimonadales bacterium]